MTKMLTFKMGIQLCPKCGYTFDAATKLEGDKGIPESGDLTVCIGCASMLEFGPDLKLSIVELCELPEDVQAKLKKVLRAMSQLKGRAANER